MNAVSIRGSEELEVCHHLASKSSNSVKRFTGKMSGLKRKRNILNVKQKLEILQKLDNGESASTDAEDVLNGGNTISHSAALQCMEALLDYMGQRGFDYGDITAVRKLDWIGL
ncbi:hypothetical protein AVEN_119841-2 [Araneus ventricosus]|uniref:HTH psq-type domain-containing protein n=3 Tax=Araneus ventricosus TaxID=182803 RepID=A0A4Y2MSK8_ARAVE|nr:hypothetical protein AVEN_119841-2 [Araneus ventricosus]